MAPILFHGLSQLGLPVVCVESPQAYQALKSLATHKTDRNDARGLAHLARTGFFKPVHKGPGKEAKLCFMGHALMENRNGLFVDACLTEASGHAERTAALHMIEPRADRPRPITLAADKAYDA
jgi:hypothetical protein